MSAVPLCWYGSPEPPPVRTPLRAGPLTLAYEAGDLRYVRLGDREVVRRWYAAVRDRNWGTVPAQLSEELLEAGDDSFRITYRADHRDGPIDFTWEATITGTADGTLTFAMDGVARTTFLRNRVGFCVLHPIKECAGAACRFELGDGTVGEGTFPRYIAPANPFRELRAFAHEILPGTWAEYRFEGDLFEMEDQRNWTDASFKTFCTPLRLPFPVEVAAGTRVRQVVTVRVVGRNLTPLPPFPEREGGEAPSRANLSVNGWDTSSPPSLSGKGAGGLGGSGLLPALGLALAGHRQPLTPREIDRLRALRPAHLRAELNLTAADPEIQLRRATAEAHALGAALELAVTVSDAAWDETAGLVAALHAAQPPLRRVLAFHHRELATPERILTPVLEAVARYDAAVPVYAGTAANFAELNRGRPPLGAIGGVCYSAQPQEHAFDNASLVECCAALADTVASARQFCGDLPIAVTPITFKKRFNPYATGPAPPVPAGQLPPTVDPRQTSLFGAGWILASLKYLAEGGAASVTFYETTGWLGVMETEAGSPLEERFPSQPGMVFPLYHVLADVAGFAGAAVLPITADQPLRLDGLALRTGNSVRVLAANLTAEPVTAILAGLGPRVRVRILNETTFAQAQEPEAFRAASEERPTAGGRLELTLWPFAYARVDTE